MASKLINAGYEAFIQRSTKQTIKISRNNVYITTEYIEGMSVRNLSGKHKKIVCTSAKGISEINNYIHKLAQYDRPIMLVEKPKITSHHNCNNYTEKHHKIINIIKKLELSFDLYLINYNDNIEIINNRGINNKNKNYFLLCANLNNSANNFFVLNLDKNLNDNISTLFIKNEELKRFSVIKIDTGTFDIIFTEAAAAIFFHELFGHMLEADKNVIYVKDFLEKLQTQTVLDTSLNIYDIDLLGKNGEMIDDEGTRKNYTILINKGRFVSFINDFFSKDSNKAKIPTGNSRRFSYMYYPQPRPFCTVVSNGNIKLTSLISSVTNGFLIKHIISAYLDKRNNFVYFNICNAIRIKNGLLLEEMSSFTTKIDIWHLLTNISNRSDDKKEYSFFCNASSGILHAQAIAPSILIRNVTLKPRG